MKTSTVNGVTYELPDGWEPIETIVPNIRVRLLFADGNVNTGLAYHYNRPIAWQHIVAPKVVPWKPKEGEVYSVVSGYGDIDQRRWSSHSIDCDYYNSNNCYPTQAAAEAARERVIAAHNGGAKWKGGV